MSADSNTPSVLDLPEYEAGESGLLDVLNIGGSCCSSCADDAEWGYDLPWVTLPNGHTVEVCCAHAKEIEQAISGL